MADFAVRVRSLSDAAWRLRAAAPNASNLPFALAWFTDDRRQQDIVSVLQQLAPTPYLPPLAVIFRHDGLGPQRLSLARTAQQVVQDKGHFFLMARGGLQGVSGQHGMPNGLPPGVFRSSPVHNIAEGLSGRMPLPDLGFVSPIFPTRSHPSARPLGPARGSAIARALPYPCFALGGITVQTAKQLEGLPFYGLGAIGAFTD